MAITWGGYSGREAVGIDVSMSPATVTAATSSVTLTWSVYVKTDGWSIYSDSQTLTLSNALSASLNYDFGTTASPPTPAGAARKLGEWTQTVSLSYTATSSRTLSAGVSGMFNGGTPSASRTVTIPKRPPQVPTIATSATAGYVHDARIELSWVRPGNAGDAGSVWSGIEVVRSVDGAPYAYVGPLSGTATSWVDTTVKANHRYQYGVRAKNASGTGATRYTGMVDTTPAAPSAVKAVKGPSGITVTWTDNSPNNESFEVRDGATVLGSTTGTTYLHTSPSTAVTHQYTVRAVGTDGGTRASAWSAPSNVVQLLGAPLAPTSLAPNGGVVDAAQNAVLGWLHTPTDTTEQTHAQVRYRLDGGAWVEPAAIATDVQTWTISAATLEGVALVEWQVRTRGEHADYSPWSAVAQFSLSHEPTAEITTPATGTTGALPTATVTWAYYQSDSHSQVAWTGRVYRTDGTTDTVVASSSGTTQTTWTTPTVLVNGGSYRVELRVRESAGLWSQLALSSWTVAFPGPLAPEVVTEWVYDAGFVSVSLVPASDGVAPEVTTWALERSIDGGPWEAIADGLAPDGEVIDWTASVRGVNTYRVTASSDLPSTVVVEVALEVECEPCDAYLSGGPDMASCVRLVHSIQRTISTGRERTLNVFAGRSAPVETSGPMVPYSIQVSADIMPPAHTRGRAVTREALEYLVSLPGPHLYRDHEGAHMWVTLSQVSIDLQYVTAVSFTATRSTGGTAAQRGAVGAYTPATLVETRHGEYQVVGGVMIVDQPGEWHL